MAHATGIKNIFGEGLNVLNSVAAGRTYASKNSSQNQAFIRALTICFNKIFGVT